MASVQTSTEDPEARLTICLTALHSSNDLRHFSAIDVIKVFQDLSDTLKAGTQPPSLETLTLWKSHLIDILRYGSACFGTYIRREGGFGGRYWYAVGTLSLLLQSRNSSQLTRSGNIQVDDFVIHTKLLPQLFPASSHTETEATELADAFNTVDEQLRKSPHLLTESKPAFLTYARFGFPEVSIPVVAIGGVPKAKLKLNGRQWAQVIERAGILKVGSSAGPSAGLRESELSTATILDTCRRLVTAAQPVDRLLDLRLKMLESTVQIRGKLRPLSLVPGQSISGKQLESKGSFGLFIKPLGILEGSNTTAVTMINANKFYGISAFHVVVACPTPEDWSSEDCQVVSPGILDILSMMKRTITAHEECDNDLARQFHQTELRNLLMRATKNTAGHIVTGCIGRDPSSSFREDWCLLEISEPWATTNYNNTSWWDTQALRNSFPLVGFPLDVELKIKGYRDSIQGEKVLKDGSSTAITAGICDVDTKTLAYYKRDINPADPDPESSELIDVCIFTVIWPVEGDPCFVLPGDSGSMVFGCGVNGGLDWVGHLVSIWVEGEGAVGDPLVKTLGLAVPAKVVLQQIEKATGFQWGV